MLQTFLFFFFLLILLIFIRAEGAIRQTVDADHLLVGVFEDEVLPLIQLHADINDASQDAPGVLYAQINLAGKFIWLELLCAQDHMAGRVLHVVTGYIPRGGQEVTRGVSGDYAQTANHQQDELCDHLIFVFWAGKSYYSNTDS